MSNVLVIKNSSVSGKTPLAADLVEAEIALNTTDKKLFTKTSAGTVVELGVPMAHIGAGGVEHAVATQSAAGFLSSVDKTKLDGIATNANLYALPVATAAALGGVKQGSNVTIAADGTISTTAATTLSSTAALANGTAAVGTSATAARADHVHPSQTTITGNAGSATILATTRAINGVNFNGSADITINAVDSTARIASSLIGAASGVCPLDATSKVAAVYLPSYVDDVLEYANLAALPASGATGVIYVTVDTSKIYRWSGTQYVEISPTAGNADTATKLATARSITLTGDVTGSVASFDGSANVSISTTIAAGSVALGTDTSGNYVAAVAVPAAGLTVSASGAGATQTLALANDLAAVEGLSATGLVRRTAADTWSAGTTIATAEITASAVTYAKIQNVSATNMLLGRATVGAGVVEEIACTVAGRTLLAGTDSSAQRTSLGLGTISTQAASAVNITGGTIEGITFNGGTF